MWFVIIVYSNFEFWRHSVFNRDVVLIIYRFVVVYHQSCGFGRNINRYHFEYNFLLCLEANCMDYFKPVVI